MKKGILNFLTQGARNYVTHSSHHSTSISADKAAARAADILEKFESHRAGNHSFFTEYLKNLSENGATPRQFTVYRDNYFYRTFNTIKSVAQHLTKAVGAQDYDAIAAVSQNFFEEGGNGNPQAVHLRLLEDSHNRLGTIVFGVPEIKLRDAKHSPFLLPEALSFRRTQSQLFSSSYPTMTGCLLAHERMADDMLINFRKSIFEPNRGYFTESEFKKLVRYYDAHRDDSKDNANVEEQHKEQALRVVAKLIEENPRTEKLIMDGGIKFLNAQANLWDGLMREMENSKHHGQVVPPNKNFLNDVPTTSPSPQALPLSKLSQTKTPVNTL